MKLTNIFEQNFKYIRIIHKSIYSIFLLFSSSKIMGFRQPGILTPYNFLMAAGVSHIAAARMVSPKGRLVDAIGIIILYTLINLFISYLYTKAPTIVSQKPIILIKR